MLNKNKIMITAASAVALLGLTGCSSEAHQHVHKGATHTVKEVGREVKHHLIRKGINKIDRKLSHHGEKQIMGNVNNSGTVSPESKTADYKTLADSNYKPGTNPVIQVNHDKSNLNTTDWKYEKIDYSQLDKLNRTGPATAYLSKRNLGKSKGRAAQRWNPTGWHNQAKKVNGKRVFPQNRGHLIAYTFTFNFDNNGKFTQGKGGSLDNPKNLATQSTYGNQQPMQNDSENLVRNALEKGEKVVYKVTPVFKDNNLMSTGYWVQAKSTDNKLNFNRFIYNVQPGIKFNYATGQSSVDSSMNIPQEK